jgi:hypothetical protein
LYQVAIVGERMLRFIRERAAGGGAMQPGKRRKGTTSDDDEDGDVTAALNSNIGDFSGESGFGSAEWDEDHVCGDDEAAEVGGIEAMLPPPAGGSSAIDILVTTPGRLMEHLDNT